MTEAAELESTLVRMKLAPAVVPVYPGAVHAVTAHAVTVTVTGATTVGSNVVVRVGLAVERRCAG